MDLPCQGQFPYLHRKLQAVGTPCPTALQVWTMIIASCWVSGARDLATIRQLRFYRVLACLGVDASSWTLLGWCVTWILGR
jgi:hypothetical protein